MSKSLSIVVPALNEARNIEATYKEILSALNSLSLDDYEILLVDDCSTDNTYEVMNVIAQSSPRVKCVRNEKNLGLGGSYKKAIGLATKEYFMLVPGDNAWPVDGLIGVLRHLGEKDIVVPYIISAGDKGPIRQFLSSGFTFFVNTLFGLKVRYYNGIVIHRLDLLKKVSIVTNSFAYQAEILVKLLKTGATYTECGLNTLPRADGKSKALKVSNLIRVFWTVAELRFKRSRYGQEFYRY